MFNPFVNVKSQSLPELEEKITNLQRKYFQTQNPDMQLQIKIVLDMYNEEVQLRRYEESEKQRQQTHNITKNVDTLININ